VQGNLNLTALQCDTCSFGFFLSGRLTTEQSSIHLLRPGHMDRFNVSQTCQSEKEMHHFKITVFWDVCAVGCLLYYTVTMFRGSLVTTAWRVLRLRVEEMAFRYGG
jgi:hypothetical protein